MAGQTSRKKTARGRAPTRPLSLPGEASPRKTGSVWDLVYDLVRKIPRGRVMTYGQISDLLGRRISAQAVGWALHDCPDGVPWQRVVNAAGACSTEKLGSHPPGYQRSLLAREGIRFDRDGRLDLERHRYRPRRS